MAKINVHHVVYIGEYIFPDWELELNAQAHRLITVVQNTKAAEDKYAMLTNLVHALTYEWNRMRMELDCEDEIDLRMRKPKENIQMDVPPRGRGKRKKQTF